MKAAANHFARRGIVAGVMALSLAYAGKLAFDRYTAWLKLESALSATPAELQKLIPDLIASHGLIASELETWEKPEAVPPPGMDADVQNRREVAMILLYRITPNENRAAFLRTRLLQAPGPDRLRLIREALATHPGLAGTGALRKVMLDEKASVARRLRAACWVVGVDPGAIEDESTAGLLVQALLEEDRGTVPEWVKLLGPGSAPFIKPLESVCQSMGRDAAIRATAAEALAEALRQHGDEAVKLAQEILPAQPEPSDILLRELIRRPPASREPAIRFLQGVIAERPASHTDNQKKDMLARQEAAAATTLAVLGYPEDLWPLLRHEADPRVRTLLIHDLAASGLTRELLKQRLLELPADRSERQAILMVWAEIRAGSVATAVPVELLDTVRKLYSDDADPGVHSAAELLLRRCGQSDWLSRIDNLACGLPARPCERRWQPGPHGLTMAILPGPLLFRMGSLPGESEPFEKETLHHRRIDRSLAVSTKEIDVDLYGKFDPGYKPEHYMRSRSCPVGSICWYKAARFCNWLSAQDPRIPRDQWCYPDGIGPGIDIPQESVERTGYRLPTEAEWEYFCRAGTVTSRHCGVSEDEFPNVLGRYAWTFSNSGDHLWPVGSLLPNEFGLFDTLGNAWEYCHEGPFRVSSAPNVYDLDYPNGTQEAPAGDRPRIPNLQPKSHRYLRGGCFNYSPAQARAAYRYEVEAELPEAGFGFRVVRTIPPYRKEGP